MAEIKRLTEHQIIQLNALLSWHPMTGDEIAKSFLDGAFHKDDIKKILGGK